MQQFVSTRGSATATDVQAILQGISPDGGLFCPTEFPQLSGEDFSAIMKLSYHERVAYVLGRYLTSFTAAELTDYAAGAYENFESKQDRPHAAPLTALDDKITCMELFHGPTCAFKDLALQILPFLLMGSVKKSGENQRVCILTATSGDTGKAALEGFKNRENCAVFVFYPQDGVSNIQKLQMMTQTGDNVGVCAIHGNFDHAQTGVKAIFSDQGIRETLQKAGWRLSSANSINLGRLLPQVAYYVSAYCDMVTDGRLKMGELLDVTVPTGNFGNILSAYYAKQMGVPLGRLICASNRNDVLTDFLRTGIYDRRRELYLTSSPSMDILVSSNFERALFHLSEGNASLIRTLMTQLNTEGVYTAPDSLKAAFGENFIGGSCDDAVAAQVIEETWQTHKRLLDPHTAVGLSVARDNLSEHPMLLVSTASPFKFGEAVCQALHAAPGTDALLSLSQATGLNPPQPLQGLEKREVRFSKTVAVSDMGQQVVDFLNKL